ncbi:MAG: cytochrome o ubiquinol oxidase subunit I [Endozoicomonas sp. (ex Botrylloides leachii)]|nr:cytochrome o ubiquinol oxidase subunit I [Endozoicomonas sp. (ex Botrylloides leachii)]
MLGKLTLDAIPIHQPIIMYTLAVMSCVGFALVAYITAKKKWKYLWVNWVTSVDHKKIGVMYIIMAFVMLFRGLSDAVLMRTQQTLSSAGDAGFLPPEHYDQIFTAHGVIMIFFVAMPLVIGLMNVAVPLQIGARDVAFPFLNNLSFWLFISGIVLINLSLAIGEFAHNGWLSYAPLSGKQYSPGVGEDYWIWGLQIAGIGTLFTGINFVTTILKMRAPGMTLMKMPVFTWTALCANILIIAAFPILTVTIGLLTLDRYLDFHFFTNDLGGNMMMYVNLIWAWGHPEVYILILPAFGVFSEVFPTFSRKPIFGYTSLVWATVAITVLSFIVWLHHFFTMGAGANVNAFFGITTMIIAVPTGVKIFNWLFTMYKGRVVYNSMMLWSLGFVFTFVFGGVTGVLMAVPGVDFIVHGTVFLVAHFHNVIIGGVVFGTFAGITYWFPKAFGFTLDERWGVRAFWFWITGFVLAFAPLYWLGLMGMPRRISQHIDPSFHTGLAIAAVGVVFVIAGLVCQVIQFTVSIKHRKQYQDTTGDPWDGRTLEWSTSSPPPEYNFAVTPKIHALDQFWEDKRTGGVSPPARYSDILMPSNTGMGCYIGSFATVFGFAAIWHIWWLAIITGAATGLLWVLNSFRVNDHYLIPASEVQETEAARAAQAENKPSNLDSDGIPCVQM